MQYAKYCLAYLFILTRCTVCERLFLTVHRGSISITSILKFIVTTNKPSGFSHTDLLITILRLRWSGGEVL